MGEFLDSVAANVSVAILVALALGKTVWQSTQWQKLVMTLFLEAHPLTMWKMKTQLNESQRHCAALWEILITRTRALSSRRLRPTRECLQSQYFPFSGNSMQTLQRILVQRYKSVMCTGSHCNKSTNIQTNTKQTQACTNTHTHAEWTHKGTHWWHVWCTCSHREWQIQCGTGRGQIKQADSLKQFHIL